MDTIRKNKTQNLIAGLAIMLMRRFCLTHGGKKI